MRGQDRNASEWTRNRSGALAAALLGRPGTGGGVFVGALRRRDAHDLRGDCRDQRAMRLAARLSVLHVGKFYPPAPGGMERIVQLLCEGEQATTDSRVLVANDGLKTTRESWRGVPVTRASSIGSIGSVGIC